MIVGRCKFCKLETRDGRGIAQWCPSSLAGERFPCEPMTQGEIMVADLARRATSRGKFRK